MDSLGDDLLQMIFSNMPATSLGSCSSACGHWHNLIDANPALWKRAYFRHKKASKHFLGDLRKCQTAELSSQSQRELAGHWKVLAVAKEQRSRFSLGSATLQKWRGHAGRVTCCGMLMDRIATGSSDKTLRIWSVESLNKLEEYTVSSGASIVDLSFDETRVVAAAGEQVYIWSRNSKGRLLKRMSSRNQRLHCLSVSDPELVVGCGDGTSRFFDIYSGRCSRIFRHHSGVVTCLGMDDSTPQLLASGSNAGKIILSDVVYGQQVASMTPNTSHAAVTCLQVTPNARFLFCATTSGTAHCLDLRNQKELWGTKVSNAQVTCMHQQKYGGSVLVTGGVDGVLRVLSSGTGELLQSYQHTQLEQPVRLVPTKRANVVQFFDDSASHSNAQNRVAPSVTTRHTSPILSVKMGLTRAVTTHSDGTVTLWHLNLDGKQRCR